MTTNTQSNKTQSKLRFALGKIIGIISGLLIIIAIAFWAGRQNWFGFTEANVDAASHRVAANGKPVVAEKLPELQRVKNESTSNTPQPGKARTYQECTWRGYVVNENMSGRKLTASNSTSPSAMDAKNTTTNGKGFDLKHSGESDLANSATLSGSRGEITFRTPPQQIDCIYISGRNSEALANLRHLMAYVVQGGGAGLLISIGTAQTGFQGEVPVTVSKDSSAYLIRFVGNSEEDELKYVDNTDYSEILQLVSNNGG